MTYIKSISDAVILDNESYENYFLVAFKRPKTGNVITFELRGKNERFSKEQAQKIRRILTKRLTVGFNSNNYDMPQLLYALTGKTAHEIFLLGDGIIKNNIPGWMTLKDVGIRIPEQIRHIDISNVAPGVRVSLKLYGARMNSTHLQDLPIPPGSTLTSDQMDEIAAYCINDLDTTIDLFNAVIPELNLRLALNQKYATELTSLGDAQIAEAILRNEIAKIKGVKPWTIKAPQYSSATRFRYKASPYIKFKTPELNTILDLIEAHPFELDGRGSIKLPEQLAKGTIVIGQSTYKLGVGGLHSQEKRQVIIPKAGEILVEADVASYYPAIILTRNLTPKHLGAAFLKVYRDSVNNRLVAKRKAAELKGTPEGDRWNTEQAGQKITINSAFGKLGSRYSSLYSPDLLKDVTLTGQLSLLLLIERLEAAGISVVSANTDSVTALVPKGLWNTYDLTCLDWELSTQFSLEFTTYRSIHSRDINNYLAVTSSGVTKGKGIFTKPGLGKNPQAPITIEAVSAYIQDDTPFEETISACKDITKFLMVRTVNGGAVYQDEFLGRVVRWIWSTDGDTINYQKNGNKVPRTDGSRPLMSLDVPWPTDLDHEAYIAECHKILETVI